MEIQGVKDISKMIRTRRKSLRLTQAECAAFCGVGVRFFSELENGKESLHISKVLHVLQMLGLKLQAIENGVKNIATQDLLSKEPTVPH
ncbi:MAG: helix-turn-helix transcriptional regulator [Fibrobacter sp.]|jgi:y4mF family transcriptional regulator|nr:helix-turn-helix transcriptional regulator [Fibrobacter sp.]